MPLEENIQAVSEIVVRTVRGDFIDRDKTRQKNCIRNYGRNPLFQSKKTHCLTPIGTRILVHNFDNNCNNRSSEFKSGE